MSANTPKPIKYNVRKDCLKMDDIDRVFSKRIKHWSISFKQKQRIEA